MGVCSVEVTVIHTVSTVFNTGVCSVEVTVTLTVSTVFNTGVYCGVDSYTHCQYSV